MPQRVMLATVGTTPQVVTETLYLLMQGPEPWIADRIEIITTGEGLDRICDLWPRMRRALETLFPAGAPPVAFYSLRNDGDGNMAFEWRGDSATTPARPDEIACLRRDIVSVEDVEAVGDLIKDRIWEHARRRDSELRLSIAGGRKTMSAHALLSLALLGRPQDDASHVLVAPPFEENPHFWHPVQGDSINTSLELHAHRTGGVPLPPPSLDPACAKTKLTLIRTPVPLVAEIGTDREALGRMRFSDLLRQVELTKEFQRRPSIAFDDATRTVTVCGLAQKLNGKPYVQLRLLARAMHEQWPGVGREGRGGAGWLTLDGMIGRRGQIAGPFERAMEAIANEPSTQTEKGRKAVAVIVGALRAYRLSDEKTAADLGRATRDEMVNWLKSMKMTDLRKELETAFGPMLAHVILPEVRLGDEEERRIGIGCGPDAIGSLG